MTTYNPDDLPPLSACGRTIVAPCCQQVCVVCINQGTGGMWIPCGNGGGRHKCDDGHFTGELLHLDHDVIFPNTDEGYAAMIIYIQELWAQKILNDF